MLKTLLCLFSLLFVSPLTFAASCGPTQALAIAVRTVNGAQQTNLDELSCTDANGNLLIFGFRSEGLEGYLNSFSVGDTFSQERLPISYEIPYTYYGRGWSFTQTRLYGVGCSGCKTGQTTYLMGTLKLE